MTPTEWGIVLAAITAVPRGVAALESIAKNWLSARRSDRPPASSVSGDKLRAVARELEDAKTVVKVNEIHEALAAKDPLTKGYIIPEHLRNQTTLLAKISEETVKQTVALQRIANNSPPPAPRPDTRYRSPGGE